MLTYGEKEEKEREREFKHQLHYVTVSSTYYSQPSISIIYTILVLSYHELITFTYLEVYGHFLTFMILLNLRECNN